MLVSHPNRELIQRAYDAFGRGDIPTVLGLLDKEIRWHVPGQSPLSGDYFGHDQVLGFFQKCMDLSEGTLRIELNDIVASDTTVFVLCTLSATRAGQHAGFLAVHVGVSSMVVPWTFENIKVMNLLRATSGLNPHDPRR
ncbi:MAG: nuclear transport factor 2 family protein [Xanthobacteraceae bacterium]|nr:nuclear transport factor 2 family protein [Xanthobacteraceae bacterium]